MNNYFNDLVISTIYVDSLLDFKDFNGSPIQYYLEEPVLVQLDAEFSKTLTYKVQQAKTELLDDIFMMWVKTGLYFA